MPDLFAALLKPSVKAVNTSAGINQLLLTGKERMTLRADIYAQFFFGRSGFKLVAAGAFDRRGAVFRMDSLFHILQ